MFHLWSVLCNISPQQTDKEKKVALKIKKKNKKHEKFLLGLHSHKFWGWAKDCVLYLAYSWYWKGSYAAMEFIGKANIMVSIW